MNLSTGASSGPQEVYLVGLSKIQKNILSIFLQLCNLPDFKFSFFGCDLKICHLSGIIGTGAISAKFAAGLRQLITLKWRLSPHEVSIVHRSLRPRSIAARWCYAKAVAEGGADAIYIATPPSEHATNALLCIEAGIPVLVEKPSFTPLNRARLPKLPCEVRIRHGGDVDAFSAGRPSIERTYPARVVGSHASFQAISALLSSRPTQWNVQPRAGWWRWPTWRLSLIACRVAVRLPISVQATGSSSHGVDEYVRYN